MTPSEEIARLRAEVRYLEALLERSIIVDNFELQQIREAFPVTMHEAAVIMFLHQARTPIDARTINDALPEHGRKHSSKYRYHKTAHVLVARIRKKISKSFIITARYEGYKLSDEARAKLDEILTA